MKLLSDLWRDERGDTSTLSFLLLTVLLAFGAIVGLTSVRNQIVQELGDVAVGLEALNQSFTTHNSTFTDFGTAFPTQQTAGTSPACISIAVGASHES